MYDGQLMPSFFRLASVVKVMQTLFYNFFGLAVLFFKSCENEIPRKSLSRNQSDVREWSDMHTCALVITIILTPDTVKKANGLSGRGRTIRGFIAD